MNKTRVFWNIFVFNSLRLDFQNHHLYFHRCHRLGNDFPGYQDRCRDCSALVCCRFTPIFSSLDSVTDFTFQKRTEMDWLEKSLYPAYTFYADADWCKRTYNGC